MNIAQHVISKCGGAYRVAAWLGRNAARIYSWTYERERGGTGGLIPAREQVPLLMVARAAGVDLQPIDFFGMSELPPLGTPQNLGTTGGERHDNPEKEVAA